MLIRSQDKLTLSNLNQMCEVFVKNYKCENKFSISAYFPLYNNVVKLGTYSSDKKAIKVLDMIQNKYITQTEVVINSANNSIQGLTTLPRAVVFEMPQDDEV